MARARTYRCDPCGSKLTLRSESMEELDELHVAFRARHQGHGKGTRAPRPMTSQQVRKNLMDTADDLCAMLVRDLRDGGICRRCGSTDTVQWAHVHSRRHHQTRWEPDNSMALCVRCHKWQTENRYPGEDFFKSQIGVVRFEALKFRTQQRGEPDIKLVIAWLRQEIRRAS